MCTVTAIVALAGCAGVPLERDKVAKISSIDTVRVEAPPVQVMTVMQAFVKSPYGDGLLPGLIADAEGRALVSPPAIPDLGLLVAQGLRVRLAQEATWWPKMSEPTAPVKPDYVHKSREFMRVSVERYEVAPAPLRTVFATVEVSLRDTANQPLWVQRKTFSGVVHGGEKIDVDKLAAGDTSQLGKEIERAADWLVSQLAGSIK
jgi:hypothetical protein